MPYLGSSEIVLIVVVAAVLFGYKKLPGIGQSLGRGLRNFKRSLSEPDEIDITPQKKDGRNDPDTKDTDRP